MARRYSNQPTLMHNVGNILQSHAGGVQSFILLFQHSGQRQKVLETCQYLFQDQGQRQSAKVTKLGVLKKYLLTKLFLFSLYNYK